MEQQFYRQKEWEKIPENKVTKPSESNLVKEALTELKSEQPQIKEEELANKEEKEEEPLELKEEAKKTE